MSASLSLKLRKFTSPITLALLLGACNVQSPFGTSKTDATKGGEVSTSKDYAYLWNGKDADTLRWQMVSAAPSYGVWLLDRSAGAIEYCHVDAEKNRVECTPPTTQTKTVKWEDLK